MYESRTYRHDIRDADLVSFEAVVRETDLFVRTTSNLLEQTQRIIEECRRPLEEYIHTRPLFLHSLEPLEVESDAPDIVRLMAWAARATGVGPMAAVAGAMAETVGLRLLEYSGEVIVENGGDIFIRTAKGRRIGIFAGTSPFSGRLALEIEPEKTPLGVCTSSGTVGPSLSLGLADAAVVVSKSAALADAAATAVGNLVKCPQDIKSALQRGQEIAGVTGILIIAGESMGAWGDVKLINLA